jgi:hypothetical protein
MRLSTSIGNTPELGAFEKFEEITILLPVFASRSRPNRLPGRCALMKDVAPRSRA